MTRGKEADDHLIVGIVRHDGLYPRDGPSECPEHSEHVANLLEAYLARRFASTPNLLCRRKPPERVAGMPAPGVRAEEIFTSLASRRSHASATPPRKDLAAPDKGRPGADGSSFKCCGYARGSGATRVLTGAGCAQSSVFCVARIARGKR